MNFFKKKDKKPKVDNADINRTLIDSEVGLGIQAPQRIQSNPIHPTAPVPSVTETAARPKSTRKKDTKEGYEWDFCLVLPNPEDEEFKKEPTTEIYLPPSEILERLHSAGLETYQYYSGDADEIYIKIRAPLDILRTHAQNIEYKMVLDPNYIKRHIENMKEPIGQDPKHTKLSPYEHIYASYDDCKCPFICNYASTSRNIFLILTHLPCIVFHTRVMHIHSYPCIVVPFLTSYTYCFATLRTQPSERCSRKPQASTIPSLTSCVSN